jgi:hypothetical protein
MEAPRCRACGANLALVGRVHRCVTKNPQPVHAPVHSEPVNTSVNILETTALSSLAAAEHRKAYRREWMRRYRANKRPAISLGQPQNTRDGR